MQGLVSPYPGGKLKQRGSCVHIKEGQPKPRVPTGPLALSVPDESASELYGIPSP